MGSQSLARTTMGKNAADERQQRIEAFKNKIANLRATSRNYNIASDRSINTLDSSFATASVDSSSNTTRDRCEGGVDRATLASAPTVSITEKPSPEETTSLPTLLDEEDDDVSGNERTDCSTGDVTEAIKLITNDDESSASTDHLFFEDSNSIEESDLFDGMLNAFRLTLHRQDDNKTQSAEIPFAWDDESSASTSQLVVEDSKSLEENVLLDGMLNTFRKKFHWQDDIVAKPPAKVRDNETVTDEMSTKVIHHVSLEEKVICTPDRPGILARRSISQSSKVSALTLATSGGFSIESIATSGISANTGASGISANTGPPSGGSINTLDSSFATASVDSSSNTTRDRCEGGVDRATLASAPTVSITEKPSPEETTSLPTLLDEEDDDVSGNERTDCSTGDVTEAIKLITNDDESSASTDHLFFEDSNSIEESDLFDGMLNAFRLTLHRQDDNKTQSAEIPFAWDDESSASTSQLVVEDSKSLEENVLLDGMLNTFRKKFHWQDDIVAKPPAKVRDNETVTDEMSTKVIHHVSLEEKVICTPDRPGILARRSISQSSKVSALTLATSGGFSIESIATSGISANTGASGISANTGPPSGASSIPLIAYDVSGEDAGHDDDPVGNDNDKAYDDDDVDDNDNNDDDDDDDDDDNDDDVASVDEKPVAATASSRRATGSDGTGHGGNAAYGAVNGRAASRSCVASASLKNDEAADDGDAGYYDDVVDDAEARMAKGDATVADDEVGATYHAAEVRAAKVDRGGGKARGRAADATDSNDDIDGVDDDVDDDDDAEYDFSDEEQDSGCLGAESQTDMAHLADNAAVRSSTAARFAQFATDEKTAPEWAGMGPDSNKSDLTEQRYTTPTSVALKMADERIGKRVLGSSVTSTSISSELEFISRLSIQEGHAEAITSLVKSDVININMIVPSDSKDDIAFVGSTDEIVSRRLRRLLEIGQEIKDLEGKSDSSSSAGNSSSSSRREKRERRHSTKNPPSSDTSSSKYGQNQKVESLAASTATDVWLADSVSTITKQQSTTASPAPSNPFADLLRLRQSHKMAMKIFERAEASVASTTTDIYHAEAMSTTTTEQESTPAPTPRMKFFASAPSSNPFADMLALRQTLKMATKQTPTNSVEGVNIDDSPNEDTSTTSKSANAVMEESSVASTATEIYLAESMSISTLDQRPPPDPTQRKKEQMRNLYDDLLRLRQTRKMAIKQMLANSGGSFALEDSSNADTSMSSKSAITEMGKNKFPLVYCDDDHGKESLDGALFSNLKHALSKIQSEDYEEDPENSNDDENDQDSDKRPANMRTHVIVKDMGSCAVSSLKDESYIIKSRKGNARDADDYSELNDDPFIDDDDEVNSVPRSPASIEDCDEVYHAQETHHSAPSSEESGAPEADNNRTPIKASTTESELVGNDGDSDTVAHSNSNKLVYRKENYRNSNLTPPRKGAVISDGSASISTKDSILGRTINISNDALASERIYLESLRAQVHAELMVHLADEEIRLALDARLHAIQNFYKRKATVLSLSKTTSFPTVPYSPLTPLSNNDDITHRLGDDFLEVKATNNNQGDPTTTPDLLGRSNVNTHVQQRQDSHMYALKRAQAKMNEAIRAAHSSPTSSSFVPHDNEEERAMDAREDGIPKHIFPRDTFWDDEDDGSTIETDLPLTRAETVQNAWSFYLYINSLIFDSRVYDYEYEQIKDDPLYPYLNSLVGIADSGEDGFADENKRISQGARREYADMSSHRICHSLTKDAEKALPELKAICADLGSKVGIQTMAVGPIKKPSEALLKCEKKYGGDPLLITDYCRTSLFVKDIATLLALIEIVLSKYTSIVKRIKLSTLKSDHNPLLGGYRDCKINLVVGGHVCEIQVHLIKMWLIKEAGGYNHYKKCCEHNVYPSSFDIGRVLAGLSRDVLNDLVKISEDDMERTPIESLQHHQEEKIRDYFALASLYLCHSRGAKAEYILRRTAKLRSESSKFGRFHAETLLHLQLLRKSLKLQHKYKSATAVKNQIRKIISMHRKGDAAEPNLSQLCAADQCGAFERVCDMILDPAKTERQNEDQKAAMVDESRALWLRMRRTFFNPS